MKNGDARDLMFAGAGVLWGAVTAYRGFKAWHNDYKRHHPNQFAQAGVVFISRTEIPAIALAGAALAAGCLGYLIWMLYPL